MECEWHVGHENKRAGETSLSVRDCGFANHRYVEELLMKQLLKLGRKLGEIKVLMWAEVLKLNPPRCKSESRKIT